MRREQERQSLTLGSNNDRPRVDRDVILRAVADTAEGPEVEMGLIKGGPRESLLAVGRGMNSLENRIAPLGQDINSLREEVHRLTNLLIEQARAVASTDIGRAKQWQYKLALLLGMRP